ncbi:MAG: hypothetical protein JXD22_03040 [Sedimentisphaerales bacterium]|nr:hypothetical protein [Sedimentisphaerales bacterium]
MGGFGVIFEENWGKFFGFLQKVASFENGLSRFWPSAFATEYLHKPLFSHELT